MKLICNDCKTAQELKETLIDTGAFGVTYLCYCCRTPLVYEDYAEVEECEQNCPACGKCVEEEGDDYLEADYDDPEYADTCSCNNCDCGSTEAEQEHLTTLVLDREQVEVLTQVIELGLDRCYNTIDTLNYITTQLND